VNWPAVERLFAAALETRPEERQALLDSDPDDAVRAEVRRLLARHDALCSQHDSFLASLDLDRAAALLDTVESEDPPAIGRYEIVRRLGSGATGVVYLARDPSLGRHVALKLLSPHLSHDATGIRRFTDEARAASRLDNPHIVAIHEIGRSEDDRLFIAMAYHEGETLRQRIARGALPVAEAVRIAGDVADGLSAAHAKGIVHRDIKPENILLTARGACIVDFGIAKVAGETLTRTGSALGTAAYMSPEQTRGTAVDQRSDLWSLGVVLYEMLTGQRPFRADGGEALIYGIRHDAAEPVTARRPGLVPAVARAVDCCLEKDPERRYQSAAALLSVLRAPLPSSDGTGAVGHELGVTQPPSDAANVAPETAVVAAARLAPTRRRRPILLAVGALLLMALGTLLWGTRPRSPAPSRSAASRTTIAVLPFTYRGSQEFAYLGEGMMDLLSANLNGAGEIRTVDPDAVLALFRQAGRARLEPEQARDLAARLGAGSYVLGNVVETGGHLRISALLHSGDPKEGRGQALVDGGSRRLFQLVDGLTAQLIAQQSGGPVGALSRLAALTTDSLAALKAYLEGERHFRAWRDDSAVQALERAIRIDSTFALAYYRMATEVRWTRGRTRAVEAVDRALRHGHRLSDRDRRLIEAYAAFLHGRTAEAERLYREIVSRHPDDLEATLQLAELISAWGSVLGHSWLDAREWFERVRSIDPSNLSAIDHLSNIAARERRLEELDSLTDRLLQVSSPPRSWFYQGQRAVASGDTAETARFMATLRKAGGEIAQPIGGGVVAFTGDLVVGRRIWRLFTEPSRSRGLRVLAHLTLAKMELMTGRWSAAKVEIDSAMALDSATALEHRALLSLWPLQQVSRSELLALRNALQQWKAAPGPSNESSVTAIHAPAHPYLRLYLLGLLSVRLDEHAPALDYAAELERRAGKSFAPAFVRLLGRAVRVEVARARGRAEQALATLDSARFLALRHLRGGGGGDLAFFPHEYEQFTRAELLESLGRQGEALQAYQSIADELFHSGAPAHLRMARIYERQGERQKAAAHYARFVELWKDCDPEFRPLVAEARQRLAP
jgi:tetratricopeptide (TPR) repeat protein/TolB-like protein